MKKLILLCLSLILSFHGFAQHEKSRLSIGYGKNLAINQLQYDNRHQPGLFVKKGSNIGDHIVMNCEKTLKKNYFIQSGIVVDLANYKYALSGAPDTSFVVSDFSFEHKYVSVILPVGLGKKFSLLNKPFRLSGGLGLGMYYNRTQKFTTDVLIINYTEAIGWDSDLNLDHFFKFNMSAWICAQYKILNYNCNPNKAGVWIELKANQNLFYNSNVTSNVSISYPDRPKPNTYYVFENFKNRPLFISFALLFDLK